jgi:hypothetical protein
MPGAIAWLLGTFGVEEPVESIAKELQDRKAMARYFPKGVLGEESEIDGAAVLSDIVSEKTKATQAYSKTRDGVALTRWILDRQPELLAPVAAQIRRKLLREDPGK